ncbi:MAG: electron transfer flavoprotein subunit beta/FixA family protein [Dehalococcoidia bacterium]|nr:electron transfer flavoprotein subunit beta/FixA family protein [Dehalococcoidia bacterium]
MYEVVVPIKQVPDMQRVRFDTETGRVDRSSAAGVVNPADLHALEVALRIKDTVGAHITVVSMGPTQAHSALKECLARGADRAILLADKVFAGADTWATSHTLASAVRKLGHYDIVVCGEKTVDGDTGQVGPEMAEWLGIPHVTYVREVTEVNGHLRALCDMGDGTYVANAHLPILITVSTRSGRPRYATPRRILEAVTTNIEQWSAQDLEGFACASKLGLKGSPTRLTKVVVPPIQGRKGERISGTPDAAISTLLSRLETGGVL